MKRVVILLGPPGAGKGTQAKRLCEDLSLPHVATGDLFRENLSQGTELGEKARAFMSQGALVPDELVCDMLFDRLSRTDAAEGFLLDGFPRTVAQAKILDEYLDQTAEVSHLLLEVDEEVIVERAVGRRLCPDCGNIHHVKHSPPRVEGKCDACGGTLYLRDDDRAETIRERLEVYRVETQPVIDYYQDRGVLVRIDGGLAPDDVFIALKRCLRRSA